MAKRISELAKELGIQSKAIIDKCVAEGIPRDRVKGHMTTIGPGMEASIREWFAGSGGGGAVTAVETTEHVDMASIRVSPRNRRGKGIAAHAADGPTVDTLEPETPTTDVGVEPEVVTSLRAPSVKPTQEPMAPHETPSDTTVTTEAEETSTGLVIARAPVPTARKSPPAPPSPAPPTEAPSAPPPSPSDTGDGDRAATHPAAAPPSKPVRMNVPTRPTVVAQVGKALDVKKPARMVGPTIVRIEQPEVVDRPRPRREGAATDTPGGRGAGVGAGAGDDDGRGSRRNRRRPPSAAPGPIPRSGIPARRKGRSGDDAAVQKGAWRSQDLIELEERLQRARGFIDKRKHAQKKQAALGDRTAGAAPGTGTIRIATPFTIKDLSAATGVKVSEIVKKLFLQNIMATANSGIDAAKAQEIMIDFDVELEVVEAKTAEERVSDAFVDRTPVDVRGRGPIVTILGHVDHGKTSLLDRIRNTNVAAGEAGGITQATSAFRVPVKIAGDEKHIVFFDTPGHQAFTEMRARGANITDVVVLVVSAPEGVMPQTIESINHAKAAKVPIVVALNKTDRPDATDARINQTLSQLAEQGLNPVEWGGPTEVVRTSATKGVGIESLLEILDLQGQMLELKADYDGPARGTVIEARMDEGRGATANLLVQDGKLEVGDFVVAGRSYGRIRDIIDDRGQKHKTVGPGWPVQISGIDQLPNAGDKFFTVDSLKKAEEAAEQRRQRERQAELAQPRVTLDTLFSQMASSDAKEILIVLKADVQGSVDVLKGEIERVGTDEVKVRVLHAAVGGITENDVLLADASRAIIIGFNVIAAGKARNLAESKGVEVRLYQVIYDITDDVRKAAEGLLAPEIRQEVLGHAEVRQVFKTSKAGWVAGCYVTDGTVERDALVRVTRDGIIVENERVLDQLKRHKDDAKDVRAGNECGMKIAGYDDIKVGDVIECYKQIKVKKTLDGGDAKRESGSRRPEGGGKR